MYRFLIISLILMLFSACVQEEEKDPPLNLKGKLEPIEGAQLDNLVIDTDLDGLFDHFELILGIDPKNPDSDGDGYPDGFEYHHHEFGFYPNEFSADRDADGLTDAFEEARGIEVLDPDSDHDGWSDFDEILNGQFGMDPLVANLDSDFDGLTDNFEAELGTRIDNIDTDGDGANDFQEVKAGTDPLVFNEAFGEVIGISYSEEMKMAIDARREGGDFPESLAAQLPFPEITSRLFFEYGLSPSAALMQRSAYNPTFSPPLYDNYNNIIHRLHNLAKTYGSGSSKYLVRLFVWSERTTNGTLPGNSVYAVKVSDNPGKNENEPEVLFLGAHHGNEMITVNIVMSLLERLVTKYTVDDHIQKKVNTTESWFIPVVNPNGYVKSSSQNLEWRKNTRQVSPTQNAHGVDINRNYGYEHMSDFTQAQRKKFKDDEKSFSGVNYDGSLYPDDNTFPGLKAFSETETAAVAGLVDDRFKSGHEVDGIKCSITWHSYGGVVMHPMGHLPKTTPGLSPDNRLCYKKLSSAFANASGYTNLEDQFARIHYPVFGETTDWLLKQRKVYALTVEAYGPMEGNGKIGNGSFNPGKGSYDKVISNNVNGALAVLDACPCTPD